MKREFSWEPQATYIDKARNLSGLAYLQKIRDGEMPQAPIAKLMNAALIEAQSGLVKFELIPEEYHNNPLGAAHGGVAAMLLDSAMACCIHTLLEAGVGYTTLEIKVNYIRPITPQTGRIIATGNVIHCGRRTATSEGKLEDKNGKLLAHGTTTCIIFR